MVQGGFNKEFTSPIPAARFWKAAVLDSHNLVPKIIPDHISSIVFLEGDGGVGTIKQYSFAQGPSKYLKNRVEVLDEEKFVYKYSVVEGPHSDKYESAYFQVQFEPTADGGSVCKLSGEFNSIDNFEPSEEEKKATTEGAIGMFKGIEAYLLANPDAYA